MQSARKHKTRPEDDSRRLHYLRGACYTGIVPCGDPRNLSDDPLNLWLDSELKGYNFALYN